MRHVLTAMLCCVLFALAGCATPPPGSAGGSAIPPAAVGGATFIVVRHAEKATDGGSDPPLSEAGRARAAALSARLRERGLVAAYATGFRRTRHTAAPAAAAHGIAVTPYDAAAPAQAFADRLRAAHASGTVLVVGHSNTVPAIVAALCACQVAAIDESDYGNLYEVRVEPGAPPLLARRSY